MTNDGKWNLGDYYTGNSYDETADNGDDLRRKELERLKKTDFKDFEDGAAMAVPKQTDFDAAPVLDDSKNSMPCNVSDLDLNQPPGFVGQIADWIDGQCRYPRRNLAVASAIVGVGNIAGLSHEDERDGVTANMMAFCVAASATGKEAVTQAFTEMHVKAGITAALHGTMKSEQEITRNAVEHQASYYNIDEIGIFLTKVRNAQKKGGSAAYLEGIFGAMMAMYSKANSVFPLSGDMSRELRKVYASQLSRAQDHGDTEAEKLASQKLDMLDAGLERPFMSLIGYTTPSTFDSVMDGETATQGLVGRAIIVKEPDINPRPRLGFKKVEMPMTMQMRLVTMAGRDLDEKGSIEYRGKRRVVVTDDDASALLDKILIWLLDYAEDADATTGEASVAMIRRSFEMVAKVSFILAIHTGTRTVDDVRWAFAYVKAELDGKVALVFANDNARDKPQEAMAARIIAKLDPEKGVSSKVLANRLKVSIADIDGIMSKLLAAGEVAQKTGKRKIKGQLVNNWFLPD